MGTWFGGGLENVGATAGFDDLRGLLQIKWFFDYVILHWILLVLAHWFTHLEECSLYAMLIVAMEKTKWEIEDLQQDLKLYTTFRADFIYAFCYYQLLL